MQASAYNNWEHGHRVGLDGALKLYDEFGITLDWLYLGDKARLPHEIAEKLFLSEPPARPAKITKLPAARRIKRRAD